jgi:hypothetical protein
MSTSEPVKTLDDLIRVCNIDTQTWQVDKWVANSWQMAGEGQFQVKANLRRRVEMVAIKAEIEALKADVKAKVPSVKVKTPTKSTGRALEIAIPDLHIGKLAWSEETGGANYDTKIAEQVFDAAVDALIERTSSYKFDRVYLPVGNDFFHSDTKQGTTTGGTILDTDSRYQKSFIAGRRMITRAINKLMQLAPVEVIMVQGNHDCLGVWHLGDSLECYYHATPHVHVRNEPNPRKYVQYGQVMLLFFHGDKGKAPDWPLLMATEQPAMFGSTKYREAHVGHIHQSRVTEFHGVKVRVSPALCSADAWHSENLYVGNLRGAEAYVWDAKEGLIGTAHYTVPDE